MEVLSSNTFSALFNGRNQPMHTWLSVHTAYSLRINQIYREHNT
jgi:hypothetical protein